MINAIFEKGAAMLAPLVAWIDKRYPLTKMWNEHLAEYYAPKNFNFWYFFGSLALLVLVIQILTGIFLTMSYKPSAADAFASVEFIMRDVNYGWLIRYMHSTGASAFFVVVYLHMFRGLMYGSYKHPRELLWILGMMIYMVLMSEAFLGYLLPWGQMSFWGAQVIVSLFEAMPFGIGAPLAEWIRGDFTISDATLNRFFAYHVIAVPLALLALVAAHIIALHEVGSNNPDGIDIKANKDENGKPVDGIPFHPYYTVKDIVGVVVFLMFFFSIVFYAPEMGGWFLEYNNFIPADPLQTPEHIAPLWYFTPFYSILRAFTYPFLGVDAKLWGVLAMGASQLLFFFLPWLDRSPVRSIRYRGPYFRYALYAFALAFVVLGYLGVKPSAATDLFWFNNTVWAQFFTVVYFAFFLLMPWYTKMDKDENRPVPERVTG